MERERFDLETITASRRKSIEGNIAPIEMDALKALGEKLFPYHDHPWREVYFGFLAQNPGSTFFHASTHDNVEIVYCGDQEKGIWYIPNSGVGPLQPTGLAIMREIITKKLRG